MGERITVTLKSMQFSARVGVLPHERDIAQPIEVDVSVSYDPRSPGADVGGTGDLSGKVDYRDIQAIAQECLADGQSFYLLEDVADLITTRVLALRGSMSARVAVRKPRVSLPGLLDYAEVILERSVDG